MDVLKYMRSLGHTFNGEMQAQKLLYYAQAWSLAWDGEPLFGEPIEAWAMGPVVRSVRYAMNAQPQPDPSVPLTDQQKANVRAVLAHYGRMTGKALGDLSHEESPWRIVWTSVGSAPIPDELMKREYAAQSARGKGPRRSVIAKQSAAASDVLTAAKSASDRWSRTLALLAE